MGAAVLWGTTGTAQALGPAGVSPAAVGAARIALGALGLAALAAGAGRLRRFGPWLRRGRPAIGVGAVALAAYQVCFFAGVARTGVAVGTVVAIGSAPAFTGLFTLAFRGERPERRWGPATALAVAGCALLLLPSGEVGVDPLGVALALGAGASYAAYAVAGKHLLDIGAAPTAAMAVLFSGGAVLLAPVLIASAGGWLASAQGVGMVLWLGLVATTAAYVLFARGLSWLPPPTAATLSLAEPLTAGALGVVVLAERPGAVGWAGALLVLSGLALLSIRSAATAGSEASPRGGTAPPGGHRR